MEDKLSDIQKIFEKPYAPNISEDYFTPDAISERLDKVTNSIKYFREQIAESKEKGDEDGIKFASASIRKNIRKLHGEISLIGDIGLKDIPEKLQASLELASKEAALARNSMPREQPTNGNVHQLNQVDQIDAVIKAIIEMVKSMLNSFKRVFSKEP